MSQRLILARKGTHLGLIGGTLILCVRQEEPEPRLVWRFKGGEGRSQPLYLSVADALFIAKRVELIGCEFHAVPVGVCADGQEDDDEEVGVNVRLANVLGRGQFDHRELIASASSEDLAEVERGHGVSPIVKKVFGGMVEKEEFKQP